MSEPSPRASRFAIAGGLAALLLVAGGGFLLGRASAPEPEVVVAPAPSPTPTPPPAPVPELSLRRAGLIQLGAQAADAFSSGNALPAEVEAMVGRRFQLSLPFGCQGPAPEGSKAALRWHYDEKAQALRIHAAPTEWAKADWWKEPPENIEVMEGFWIARPWSTLETCPPAGEAVTMPEAAEKEAETTPAPPTLGVAQLVAHDAPRQLARKGKPYDTVVKRAAEQAALPQGAQLRLTGRIARFPSGKPVRCAQFAGWGNPPACLIAVTIEEVSLRDPARDETLSTWQLPTSGPAGGAVNRGGE